MAGAFEEVYTDAQREAMATAYVDRGIKPARLVVELAERGELVDGLEPFTVHGRENTVRDCARKLRDRRAGRLASEAARQPPRDAIEALRRRLVSAIEHELTAIEREQRKAGKDAGSVDPERLRQLARAVREAALIPEPGKVAPAAKPPAEQGKRSNVTRGGLAGRILADAERAEPDAHRSEATSGGMAPEPATAPEATNGGSGDMAESPGAWAREQLEPLAPA